MNILRRPGWADYLLEQVIEERVPREQFTKLKAEAEASGFSTGLMGSPQEEIYKIMGQIIIDDPEIGKYFPAVTKPRHLRASMLQNLPSEVETKLQSKVDEVVSNLEKFKETLAVLHAGRRAKTTDEFLATKGTDLDTREKVDKWARAERRYLGMHQPPQKVGYSDLTPEEQENVKRAEFRSYFPALMSTLSTRTGETYDEIAEEYPEIKRAIESSSDIDSVLEGLISMSEDRGIDSGTRNAARAVLQSLQKKLTAYSVDDEEMRSSCEDEDDEEEFETHTVKDKAPEMSVASESVRLSNQQINQQLVEAYRKVRKHQIITEYRQ